MNFAEMNVEFLKIANREKDKFKLDTQNEINAAVSIFNKNKDDLWEISQKTILATWGLTDKVNQAPAKTSNKQPQKTTKAQPQKTSTSASNKAKTSPQQVRAQIGKAVSLAITDANKHIVEQTENDSVDIRKYKMVTKGNNLPYCAWGVNWFLTRGQGAKQNLFGLSDQDVGSSQAIKRRAKENGVFRDIKKEKYQPKPGDIIVYTSKSNSAKGHVGIVVSVNKDGSFDTVDPNSHETVERITYTSLADAKYPKGADGRRTSELVGFVDMEAYYKKYPLK